MKDSVSGIKKVNEETNKSFIQQESKIRALTAVINDNGIALDVRRKALNDLKEIIPDYNAQLTDEGTLTKNNTDAIKDYLVQLEKQIKLKAAQQELENLYAQKRTLEKDEETQSDQYWKIRQTNTLQGYNRNSLTAKISRLFGTEKEGKALETLNETRKNLSSISEKIDEITKEIGESALAIEEVNKANEETTNNKITTPIIDEEKAKALLKKKLEEEAKLYSQHQSELKEAYLKRQDETLQTEQQFNDRMETLELEHQQRIINIAGAKSKEGIDAQNRINDIKIKQQKEQMNRQLAEEKTLYENQQKDLKLLYVSGKNENLKTEKEYNEAMEHLTIMHLERVLKIANLDADQRRTIEQQLLDFKVKCLQDEEKERKKLEDAAQKKKDELARKEKQRLTEQAQQYRQYGEQIGDTLGQMISGQENALQNFADTMLDILFDVLSQMIDIEIAKATGVAVGAVARSAAEAYAMPDSVATFGATGAARAAVLSGLIMGALAAAKSTLKGLIKRGSSSTSATDNNTDSTKTAQVQVKQWASGRYDVIGEDDGRTYRDVPYIGDSPTGIVRRTSLISESGAELIINAEDLSRLQHHINYPIVVQAIQDARSGRLPQRAEGNYDPIRNSTSRISQTTSSPTDKEANLAQLIKELHALIEKLKYLKAYIVLRELNEAQELADKSKEPFTRKKQ
ncbi:hypothetical protein NXY02_15870 [Bacteroides fragilis]|nr:hypothetical protein [Bacteroides fragilis]